MDDSIITVTVQSMRPDIEEAKATPGKIKGKLVYRDEDELETGMQKVQPLAFLDEEIHTYKDQIRDSLPAAQAIPDDIPAQVLGKVNNVIKVAKEGQTTLFKASQLLEFTSDAFLYARKASQNKTDLQRESVESLKKYDETFKMMIESRIKTRMEDASEQQEECIQLLERAVKQAESDHTDQMKWAEDEDKDMKEDVLKEIQENVDEIISDETSELEMIKSQCDEDVKTIELGVSSMHSFMDKATEDYKSFELHNRNQLEVNRAEQRRLEDRLKQLRQDEEKLIYQIESGQTLQGTSDAARKDATREMDSWKGKIKELSRRTETSLQVMDEMKNCTDMIMDDAMKWKKTRQDRLDQQELDSLLILRDCLMAHGALQKMVLSDSERNASMRRKEVVTVEKEKKEAARTGFAEKVKELDAKINDYKSHMLTYEKKIEDTKQTLEEITEKLQMVDGKLRERKDSSSIRLDSMEERYKHLKKLMDQAYDKESTDKVCFNSFMSYTAGAN